MTDLDQQLRQYGAYLDELDAEPNVSAESERDVRRWLAAAAVVTVLVGGGVAVVARHDSRHRVTVGGGGPESSTSSTVASTTTFADSSLANAQPSFAQQVERLETWYAHAVADAPGGRPILVSEYELCDYRGDPALGTNAEGRFASYFPIGESLTEARLVDGCLENDSIPKGTTAAHQLCTSDRRGPIYDSSQPVGKLPTKPVVVFGNTDCAAAGYQPFTLGLLDDLNRRRHVEIAIMAVPRSCPTESEAAFWATKITAQELGAGWSVVAAPSPSTSATPSPTTIPPTPTTVANCVRPGRVDWDTRRVTLERF